MHSKRLRSYKQGGSVRSAFTVLKYKLEEELLYLNISILYSLYSATSQRQMLHFSLNCICLTAFQITSFHILTVQ